MVSVEKYIFTAASSEKPFLLGPKNPTFLCAKSEWNDSERSPHTGRGVRAMSHEP